MAMLEYSARACFNFTTYFPYKPLTQNAYETKVEGNEDCIVSGYYIRTPWRGVFAYWDKLMRERPFPEH